LTEHSRKYFSNETLRLYIHRGLFMAAAITKKTSE